MQHDIRTLRPSELDEYHFRDTQWHPVRTRVHPLFHINRLEDTRDKLTFPIPPHRKTLHDFIFITHGHSKRSKGLHEYEFGTNTFFFLPAYQISTNEFMSRDVRGYFCHFDTNIFEQNYFNYKALADYSFLQPSGDPIVSVEAPLMRRVTCLLEWLEEEYEKPNLTDFSIVAAYLIALFSELKQIVKP